MVGLSNSPIPLPTIDVSPSVASTPIFNSSLYDTGYNLFTNQVAQNGSSTLGFPNDQPKYVLTFTFSQYTRKDLNSIGQFVAANGYPGIVLPMPDNMKDLDSVNWKEEELGFAGGMLTNAALNGLAAAQGVPGAGAAAAQQLGAAGAGIGLQVAQGAAIGVGNLVSPAIGGALAGAFQGIEAAAGIAPNQFVTLMMHGPRFKRHAFNWTLAPNNFDEADQIRQIIKIFRNAMAPGIWLSAGNVPAIWSYPKIWYLRIYPNSKFMYKFKPCICDGFAVNYTPMQHAAFSRNGTNNIGDNPPTAVQIQMSLIELEFWTEGNYNDSNIPDDVYSNTVTTNSGNDKLRQLTDVTIGNIKNISADIANQLKNTAITPAL